MEESFTINQNLFNVAKSSSKTLWESVEKAGTVLPSAFDQGSFKPSFNLRSF